MPRPQGRLALQGICQTSRGDPDQERRNQCLLLFHAFALTDWVRNMRNTRQDVSPDGLTPVRSSLALVERPFPRIFSGKRATLVYFKSRHPHPCHVAPERSLEIASDEALAESRACGSL
jgi:hypothetical protein